MVALAPAAYHDPHTDPAEVLTLTTRQQVSSRLMDAFLTATYTFPPAQPGTAHLVADATTQWRGQM